MFNKMLLDLEQLPHLQIKQTMSSYLSLMQPIQKTSVVCNPQNAYQLDKTSLTVAHCNSAKAPRKSSKQISGSAIELTKQIEFCGFSNEKVAKEQNS
jgi:hypothetical protein